MVESVRKGTVKSQDSNAQTVVNYLTKLGAANLNFILSIHPHSDHIGGMSQMAYHFVDKNTIYLYKQYRPTSQDNEVSFHCCI